MENQPSTDELVARARVDEALATGDVRTPDKKGRVGMVDALSDAIQGWNDSMGQKMSLVTPPKPTLTSVSIGFGVRDARPWWRKALFIGKPFLVERKSVKYPGRAVLEPFTVRSPDVAIPLGLTIRNITIDGYKFTGFVATFKDEAGDFLCYCDRFEPPEVLHHRM